MEISESSDLYLIFRNGHSRWLARDSNGHGISLTPQPTILRAAYSLNLEEQTLSAAKAWLMGEQHWLLALAPGPDGSPHRSTYSGSKSAYLVC
jgi:hypothetical protein